MFHPFWSDPQMFYPQMPLSWGCQGWRIPPGSGEEFNHGNHRQGISALRGSTQMCLEQIMFESGQVRSAGSQICPVNQGCTNIAANIAAIFCAAQILLHKYLVRCGPLGHKYVQPTWETTYNKTYRKPTTTSTTQYFTKSTRCILTSKNISVKCRKKQIL